MAGGGSVAVARISRLITLAAFVAVGGIAWALLIESGALMAAMDGESWLSDLMRVLMRPAAAGPYLAAAVLMWAVMMIAMMTPAVLPVLLMFLRLERPSARGAMPFDGALLAAGYLVVWFCFALIASSLQWGLHRAALLHTHALAAPPALAGGLLIGAGLYQLTPLKAACLKQCQSPLGLLVNHWRDGPRGAFVMGLTHGRYCLGCCWALMLLMFAGGVMSVAAMAVLSLFILAERLLPAGPWAAKLPGLVLIGWGLVTLVT